MSIELIDKIDQKRSKRYQKVGFNDLLLVEEEVTADGIMCDIQPSGSGEDYMGMELEHVLEHHGSVKKRHCVIMAVLSIFLLIVTGVLVLEMNKTNTTATPTKNHYSVPGNDGDSSVTAKTQAPSEDILAGEINDDRIYAQKLPQILWPTSAPLSEFDICPPPVNPPNGISIYHMGDFSIVPEDKSASANDQGDDEMDKWKYTFSSMDISEEASIIAVGLSDFSRDTDWAVGLVRVFAWACESQQWMRLGQDLLGTNQYAAFGCAVSSSRDGRVMAISATQDASFSGTGYVEVYYLNGNHWDLLGARIDFLDCDDCFGNFGSSIDLSDSGETLAVLGKSKKGNLMRVHSYNSNTKQWQSKGDDVIVSASTFDDFSPSLILSKDGNELAIGDAIVGVLKFHFNFLSNKWEQTDKEGAFLPFANDEYFVNSFDMDGSGNLVAFSAFGKENTIKIIDYSNGNGTDVYIKDYKDLTVSVFVDVSKDGQVAAALASHEDDDDHEIWYGDYAGVLTIVSKDEVDGQWRVVGEGTKVEKLEVQGSFVSLSGDGTIAAVGSNTVISLFGIALNHKPINTTTPQATFAPNVSAVPAGSFNICAPFRNATSNSHAGNLKNLPIQEEEHTLTLAMSADASILAVGIKSFVYEQRGLVRVFAWDCDAYAYAQLGQDLFGDDPLDAFGQSIDLSSDGKILVVGANQPPPGKSGYVDVYSIVEDQWRRVGKRLTNMMDQVEELGREVRISSDGNTVAIHGCILATNQSGYTSSFVRIVKNVNGEWQTKGDDLVGSIIFDGYGSEVKIDLSSDGNTLVVSGDYTTKIYTFNGKSKNWTEMSVSNYDSDDFLAVDVGLSNDGKVLSTSGWQTSEEGDSGPAIIFKSLVEGRHWTTTTNYQDSEIFDVSSVSMSGDAKIVAVGVSTNSDLDGEMFVAALDDQSMKWETVGNVVGLGKGDFLGARVCVSNDGSLAAASSKKGYVSFFKISGVSLNITQS